MEERLKRLKELLKNPFKVKEFLEELRELEKALESADPQTLKKVYQEYEKIKELFFKNYEMLRGLWEVRKDVRT